VNIQGKLKATKERLLHIDMKHKASELDVAEREDSWTILSYVFSLSRINRTM